MSNTRVPAPRLSVAKVMPLLGVSHLDRVFEYRVSEALDAEAQPGVRVRVRFSGRLVDALLLDRTSTATFDGELAWLDRVISPVPVYTESTRALVEALTVRYAGVTSDLIRNVIPARHARAEAQGLPEPWDRLGTVAEPDLSEWMKYEHGQEFVDAVLAGQTARVAWQIAPTEAWATTVAALGAKVAKDGGGVLIVLPDQRDVDRMEQAFRQFLSAKQITVMTAAQGPQARYRRFLNVVLGQARVVIGTRNAAFAPVHNLRLAVIKDDGDSNLVDPKAPYVHAREVLTTRSSLEQCSLVIAGVARTAEAQLLVESGWCSDLVAPRAVLKALSPRIEAVEYSEYAFERNPHAHMQRIPSAAFQAIRTALDAGLPALVQTPRKGYVPALACARCRTPARCRVCNGPLVVANGRVDQALERQALVCRWCGRPEPAFRCGECGHQHVRAVVFGSERTGEELGRAFPGKPVVISGGQRIVDAVEPGPKIVVATPGAEPWVTDGRYGAVVLLDAHSVLSRQDLRASEAAMAAWGQAAVLCESSSNGGTVVIAADHRIPEVQSMLRWDFRQAAQRELASRRETHLPPAAHLAAVDGPSAALDRLLSVADLPSVVEVLGPVDLPPESRLPGEYDEAEFGPPQRLLIRTPLRGRNALGAALRAARIQLAVQRGELPMRIQVDPIRIG